MFVTVGPAGALIPSMPSAPCAVYPWARKSFATISAVLIDAEQHEIGGRVAADHARAPRIAVGGRHVDLLRLAHQTVAGQDLARTAHEYTRTATRAASVVDAHRDDGVRGRERQCFAGGHR